MSVTADLCGTAAVSTEAIESRWAMNYAAAIADPCSCYYDGGEQPVSVHPMYLATSQWTLSQQLRTAQNAMTAAECGRGIHAAQRVSLARPLRVGDVLTTRATIVGVERARSGARLWTRFDTTDDAGSAVATCLSATVYPGVGVEGESVTPDFDDGDLDHHVDESSSEIGRTSLIKLPRAAAHQYSECARIWNPIHTDVHIARAAGLAGPILHGSTTLALAVSDIIRHEGGARPHRFVSVSGNFTATVPLPSTVRLQLTRSVRANHHRAYNFTLLNDQEQPAITSGHLHLID